MYRVRLKDFEGPLDLLLFLVRKNELDIFEIPIASITEEYLEYVQQVTELDLDRVGDFLYAAAMLIGLKARMLLPQPETEDSEAVEAPLLELVERLLEYERYKVAAQDMLTMQARRLELFTRGQASAPSDEQLQPRRFKNASGDALLKALYGIVSQTSATPSIRVQRPVITIAEQREYILNALQQVAVARFSTLVAGRGRPFVVATFLATLEMAFQGIVGLHLSDTGYDFGVRRLDAATG